jgi:hypothetical protein
MLGRVLVLPLIGCTNKPHGKFQKEKQFLNRILGAHRESLLRRRSSAIASCSTLWKLCRTHDLDFLSACYFGRHNGAIRDEESCLHALARRCSRPPRPRTGDAFLSFEQTPIAKHREHPWNRDDSFLSNQQAELPDED